MTEPSRERSSTKLYTPRLLGLAAELAEYPYSENLPLQSEARSKTCGSSIALSAETDGAGNLIKIGMQVTACAVGQSSAAIMGRSAKGQNAADVAGVYRDIEAWLAGRSQMPDWPGMVWLEPALAHPGRHGALLLPWKALYEALSREPLSSHE